MRNDQTSAEELRAIRRYMEESTKFLSLSGFSGVVPGLLALTGALFAWFLVFDKGDETLTGYFRNLSDSEALRVMWELVIIALCVLVSSVSAAVFFSYRKGRKEGKSLWTPASKRLYISLLVPLVAGAAFVTVVLVNGYFLLAVPSLLIFYGLALINAGKFTYGEIFYLGLLEIATGLLCAVFPLYALVFWITGFGLLHILYGLVMFRKYEA